MSTVLTFLQGKKTYIIAVAFVVIALLQGDQTMLEQVKEVLMGAGLAALRAGVSKLDG